MAAARDVADFFLTLQDEDEITNLKLQKLLYYAQGFHLAVFDRPLFSNAIEAWAHGPVVPHIWRQYRGLGSNPLPRPSASPREKFDSEQQELLEDVYRVYGQFSAWRLRDMTHNEPPWKKAFDSAEPSISTDEMKRYFKTQLA